MTKRMKPAYIKLEDRFIVWSDRKFNDQHEYIMCLFEWIDEHDIFNPKNGIAMNPIPYGLYKERYLNDDDLDEMARSLSIHHRDLTDCFDFGLFELKMCRKMERVIFYTEELIKEFSLRLERKRMRKINDMMEELSENINDVRGILTRFKPALNHIKKINRMTTPK